MKEKKMKQLETEQDVDDEFVKMLQEFISKPTDTPADPDEEPDEDLNENSVEDLNENSDENLNDDNTRRRGAQRKEEQGKRQTASHFTLTACVMEDGDTNCYSDGPVTVHIATQDGFLPDTDRFKCYVYTTDYYPMCNSRDGCEVYRNGNELTYVMHSPRIWLPGGYVLLVRDKDDSLVRMEFFLDDSLNTFYDDPVYTRLCDIDDVLTASVETRERWWRLAVKPGMRQLRKHILQYQQLAIYNEFRKALSAEPLQSNSNFLICTQNKDLTEHDLTDFMMLGTGLTSLDYVDCSTLYDPTCNNPYEHLGEVLSIMSRVLCLTNLGALLTTGGKTIVKRILDKLKEKSPDGRLWLCGSASEIRVLFDQFPSLKELYTHDSWIEHEAYTPFELVQAFFCQLEAEHLEAPASVKDKVARAIIEGCEQGTLAHWSLSDIRRVIADHIRPAYVRRALSDFCFDTLPVLTAEDIDTRLFVGDKVTYEDCLQELNEMVGLDEVKQGVMTMANNTRFFLERRRRGLRTSGNVAYHAIFTGNPGTGKTTVARQLGKIYRSLGLLSKGEVIAVDRTRLVGRYIGETEENMKAVLEEARGNVLFVDEAYTLYDGSSDRKDFGARVIDSLLTVLSQPNPDMLIVFAGYEKEMDAMLNTNPGLMGRFPYKYKFQDYNAGQLMEIASRLFQRDDYILVDEARDLLMKTIVQTLSQPTRNFGNARWVEQYVRNGIIPAMANRLAATACEDYRHVEADDIRKGYERFNPKAVELKSRQKVGFSA